MLQVSDSYVATGRPGLRRIEIDFLSLPNDVNAKAILLSMSLVTLGTELPRNTKLFTFSRSYPFIKMLLLNEVRTLYLLKLNFIPHFKQSCCISNVAS